MEWNSDSAMSQMFPERWQGHISLPQIGLEGQRALSLATVAVVGAGGLGSACLIYLAAAGVGTLRIIDGDTVSESNLQRQVIHTEQAVGALKVESAAASVRRINSAIRVDTFAGRLTHDNAERLLGGAAVVLDCTDSFGSRMLVGDECSRLGLRYVYGAVARWSGHLFTHIPGSAGYRDIFGPEAAGADMSCSVRGVLNTLVGTVGTLQATEAVKLITGAGEPLINRLLTIDLLTMDFRVLNVEG